MMARIDVDRYQLIVEPFYRLPESTMTAVALPLAKADSTAFLMRKNAGTLYFSNMSSVSFSRLARVFHEASEINTG